MDKYCEMMKLADECRSCRKCKIGGVHYEHKQDGRTVQSLLSNVFSNMQIDANLMVVGQNPGWDEMRSELPFVGASGKIFDRAIKEVVGLERRELYISNAQKCYTPENRKPFPDELENCQYLLDREIEIIQPKIIIALGSIAFTQLTGMNRMMRHHGEIIFSPRHKISVIGVLHPSPFNMGLPDRKEAFYSDLQKLKEFLHV